MSSSRWPRGQRQWLPTLLVVAGGGCAVAAVLLFGPSGARGWLAGVLTAALAGYLTNAGPALFGRLRAARVAPIVVTARVLEADNVYITEDDGRVSVVPASGHIVRILVEAVDSRTTVLDQLRAIVVSRAEARGKLSPHLGIVEPRPFDVLLDEDPPVVRPRTLPDGTPGPSFPFKVGPDDPEIFELVATTADADVRWLLELDWTCAGRHGTTRIDLAGMPLRTVARPGTATPDAPASAPA